MPECIPTPRTHSNSSVVECCHCHRLHIEGAYGVAKQICCKVADAVPGLGPGPASKIVMRLVQQSASQVLTVEASCVHHGCTGLACLQKPFLRYSQAHKTQLHACSAATCFTCVGCRRMLCAPCQHHGCTGPACLQMLYLQHPQAHKHSFTFVGWHNPGDRPTGRQAGRKHNDCCWILPQREQRDTTHTAAAAEQCNNTAHRVACIACGAATQLHSCCCCCCQAGICTPLHRPVNTCPRRGSCEPPLAIGNHL